MVQIVLLCRYCRIRKTEKLSHCQTSLRRHKKAFSDAQTSCLEGFHAILNHWHQKMIGFSWLGTFCRWYYYISNMYVHLSHSSKAEPTGLLNIATWRCQWKTGISDDFGCFCFLLQISWIFACNLHFSWKALPRKFFCWLALRFREITYAKTVHH